MSEDPPTANVKPSDEPSGPEEDELSGPKEIVLSPPPGPPIIEDTASPPGTDNYAPSESEFVGPSAGVRQVYERRSMKVHIGPLPDPETLNEGTRGLVSRGAQGDLRGFSCSMLSSH